MTSQIKLRIIFIEWGELAEQERKEYHLLSLQEMMTGMPEP